MKLQRFLALTLIISCLFILFNIKAKAASIDCKNLDSSVSTMVNSDLSGSLYVRLPKSSLTTATKIDVYLEKFADNATGNCSLVGSSNVSTTTWMKISDNYSLNKYDQLFISGDNIGAGPYQAAMELLVVSDNACIPKDTCEVKTSSGTASLTPILKSSDTDQVAIFNAVNVNSESPQIYNYFDNSKLAYSLNKYKPFNQNYLNGGVHNINIQAVYNNKEKLNYYSKVDMGNDWSKWLFIRSTFYKAKTTVKIAFLVILFIFLVLLGIVFYHFVIKRIKEKRDHGLDVYKDPDAPDDNIVIGINK